MELAKRIFESAFRSVNEDTREVEFVASDATPDSFGTVIPVSAWNLERFAKNGVIGYQHDIYCNPDPDSVIGVGVAFVDGEQLIVRVKFEPADLNEKADKIYRKILFGSIKGVSVGFSYDKGHWGDEEQGEDVNLYYFDKVTLLEVSVVNIPSNPNAVKRSLTVEEEEFRGCKPKKKGEDPVEVEKPEDEEEEKEEEDDKKNPKEDEEIRNYVTIVKARLALANKNN